MKTNLTEQKLPTIINSIKFITNLVYLIELVLKASARSVEHPIGKLKKIEPLLRQSFANGRKDLKKGEILKVIDDTKKTLDAASKNLGYNSWEELKSEYENSN